MTKIASVLDYLKLVALLKKRPSSESFLLEHGQSYDINAKTYEGPHGTPGLCYMNATLSALETGRTYVEGCMLVFGVPLDHAWTVDAAGQVYDPTIEFHEMVSDYYGVPFKRDYLLRALIINKHYGLLGHSSKSRNRLIEGKVKNFKA